MSSGWFYFLEPLCSSRKHAYREGSSKFGHRTSSNLLEPLCSSGKHAYREGSSDFWVVQPHRTSLNHCVQVGSMPTGKVQVSSGWFDLLEPLCSRGKHAYGEGSSKFGHRTSSNLLEPLCSSGKHAYREGSSEFLVVRPNRTSLNHCVQVGSMPTGKVQVSSGWFNLLEPLCSSGKHAYREGSSEFGVVRPHQTSLNHCVQV